MPTLPTTMVQVLAPFVPLFSERVWAHVRLLLAGAILAPGKRTVASALTNYLKTLTIGYHRR